MRSIQSALLRLECPECGRLCSPDTVQTSCLDCQGPLLAVYNYSLAKSTLNRESLLQRQGGIWRWSEILPVRQVSFRFTVGESIGPVLQADNLGQLLGLPSLYIKDESRGPSGSLDHRGLIIAVARALELGVHDFALAAFGADGTSLAACAARSRSRAHIYMPQNAPMPEQIAIKSYGADLILVDGSFSDAVSLAASASSANGWLNLTAFCEPYRIEGAKTLGLEIAESFAWILPQVIIIPVGAGLELLGMWKAFNELEQLGLIGSARPRFVAVQASGCAPLVNAFDNKSARVQPWQKVETGIPGMQVSDVFADRMILRAVEASMGVVMAVSDTQILDGQKEMASCEGIFAAPQAGACLAALKQLTANSWIKSDERVLIVNPGSGLNYLPQ